MVDSRMRPDSRARPGAGVHTRVFDGELVILDLSGGEYYALNATGTRFWRALEDGRTPREVGREIADECGVEFEAVLLDLLALGSQLLERGLLVPERSGK